MFFWSARWPPQVLDVSMWNHPCTNLKAGMRLTAELIFPKRNWMRIKDWARWLNNRFIWRETGDTPSLNERIKQNFFLDRISNMHMETEVGEGNFTWHQSGIDWPLPFARVYRPAVRGRAIRSRRWPRRSRNQPMRRLTVAYDGFLRSDEQFVEPMSRTCIQWRNDDHLTVWNNLRPFSTGWIGRVAETDFEGFQKVWKLC